MAARGPLCGVATSTPGTRYHDQDLQSIVALGAEFFGVILEEVGAGGGVEVVALGAVF